jgi:ATP-dependent DNA helicase RecQ
LAFNLFRHVASFDDVVHQTGRTRSTVTDYLAEWIRSEKPKSISAWVPPDLYERVAAAARVAGTARLKPIFIALGEQVPYEVIRAVVTHQDVTGK